MQETQLRRTANICPEISANKNKINLKLYEIMANIFYTFSWKTMNQITSFV